MNLSQRLLSALLICLGISLPFSAVLGQESSLTQCSSEKRRELRLQGLLEDVIAWRCGDFPKARILAHLEASSVLEGDEGTNITIQLNRQPASSVRISLRSALADEVILDIDELTFTTSDWNQPRHIAVKSIDDDIADGDRAVTLQLAVAATEDTRFRQAAPVGLVLQSLDNDVVDWSVTRQPGQLQEGGVPVIYEISLLSRPMNPVTLRVDNKHPDFIRVAPDEIQITPDSWPKPELLRVQAVDDPFDNPDRPVEILASVKSTTDQSYLKLPPLRLQLLVEDDENPGIVINPERGVTTEAGTQAKFDLKLRSQPRSPVQLKIESSDDTEGKVSSQEMRFTAADWDRSQQVIVEGLDDLQRDGDQSYELSITIDSTDEAYLKLSTLQIPLINSDNDIAELELESSSDQISEDGESSEISIRLLSEPKGEVIVQLSLDKPDEATLFPNSLTFDKSNWNIRQRLLVVGKDDNLADGDQTVTVFVRVLGDSPEYVALASQQITLTNRDDDIASILIRAPERLSTSESGTSDHFEVLLQSRPEASVRIPLRTSQPNEVSINPEAIVIQPENWDQPQRVTIQGLDDERLDGSQFFLINILPAESNDQLYQGLDATDLVGTNEDNDQPGILTSTGNLRVSESFGEDQLKIRLNSRPNEAVRIQLNSSAPDEFSVLPEQLIFTPEDWNLEQSVTVRGLPDEVAEASSTYQLLVSVTQGEENYKGLETVEVIVAVEDQTPELPPTMIRAMSGLQYVALAGRMQRGEYSETGTDLNLSGQSQGLYYNHHWPSHLTAGVALERAELTGQSHTQNRSVTIELEEYRLQASGGYAWYFSPEWRLQPELRLSYNFLSAKRTEEDSNQRLDETLDGGIFTSQFGSGLHYLANETFFVGAGIYLDPNKVSLGFADAKGNYNIIWSSEFMVGLQF